MTTCEHYCLLSAHHKLINNFIIPQASSPRLQMTPAGLEPAIPGSVGRCLIHWATGPIENLGTNKHLSFAGKGPKIALNGRLFGSPRCSFRCYECIVDVST